MAEIENKAEITDTNAVESQPQDFMSLISSSDTDFLVGNNGQQVNIDTLKGKKIGLYFSAASWGPCQAFTPPLIEFYNKISTMHAFEIVFVSGDENEESFNDCFSKMPWLALPFSDSDTRDRLLAVFEVDDLPHLVFIDENGQVWNNEGVEMVAEYGVAGYPFSQEKITELKDIAERAREEQSLKSLLVSESRDFVISSDGNQVPLSELEGKTIGLFFSVAYHPSCTELVEELATVYKKLKEMGNDFEIIYVSCDEKEQAFKDNFETMPWLAIPYNYMFSAKLCRYFDINILPILVILGPDGKTLHSNGEEAILQYGISAYPFTPEKFLELETIEKMRLEAQARLEAQFLESLLITGDLDYVIGKDEPKVPIS